MGIVQGVAAFTQELVADGATLTATDISVRNSGCGITVSNATLVVDSTAGDAIQVGRKDGTGGEFVLSGENACLNYERNTNSRIEVFTPDSGNAEFRIEKRV